MGRELLARVEEDLQAVGQIETTARDEGRNIFIIVAPKSQN